MVRMAVYLCNTAIHFINITQNLKSTYLNHSKSDFHDDQQDKYREYLFKMGGNSGIDIPRNS